MLYLIFLSSGLFLGWSLGANDASNVFGTAVGSRMVSFRKAAWIASIFVLLGAVVQGHGAANTLTTLGAINALGGAFTVALCAAITVYWMTKAGLPVSTGQAIVGAIVGWTLFAGFKPDMNVLLKIVTTWVSGPILGMGFSVILFLLFRRLINKSHIHRVKLDVLVRWGLIFVGAFGAYSLGANNIANVIGVFIPTAPTVLLSFGFFSVDGVELLFLLGGLAIAAGIFTYSKKVMQTVGNGIMALTPETALVVVLAQAIVLFLFSSKELSSFVGKLGLPPIPLVPVSSTQVVVGAVIGIGLIKGGRELNFKLLGEIALGWITTPLAAGALTFFALFFTQNIFQLKVVGDPQIKSSESLQASPVIQITYDLTTPGLYLLIFALLILLLLLVFNQQKLRLKAENMMLVEQKQAVESIKALNELELQNIHLQNTYLANSLEVKKQQFNLLVKNLTERRTFLEYVANEMEQLVGSPDIKKRDEKLMELIQMLKQRMSFTQELEEIYRQLEETHKGFQHTLAARFPTLTDKEIRIALLLRLGFSLREISVLTNATESETDTAIQSIRNKLTLNTEENLSDFLSKL